MNDKIFSIVTVSFNAALTIEKTFSSIVKYKNSQIEYIVIDGGSSDGTIELIKKYNKYIDKWLSENDEGIYDAMNKGVKIASGKWVLFLGADDLLSFDLTLLQHSLEDGISYYGNVRLLSSGNIYDGSFNRYKILKKNICHQAILYYGDILRERPFDKRYRIAADYEMNLFIFGSQPSKIKYINIVIAYFNDAGISSIKKDLTFSSRFFLIFLRHFPLYLYPIYPVARISYYICRIMYYKRKLLG